MAIDQHDTITDEERLNALYWDSSRTIDEIVEELSVGRNTLYASIQPLSAGLECASCAGEVAFTNRTSRASGTGHCLVCGLEVSVPDEGESLAGAESNGVESEGRWEQWREDLGAVAPERAAMIGGAAALGVMLGVAAAKALKRPSLLS